MQPMSSRILRGRYGVDTSPVGRRRQTCRYLNHHGHPRSGPPHPVNAPPSFSFRSTQFFCVVVFGTRSSSPSSALPKTGVNQMREFLPPESAPPVSHAPPPNKRFPSLIRNLTEGKRLYVPETSGTSPVA